MEILKQYRERAIQFAEEWEIVVSEHNLDIMVSIMAHRDGVFTGGGFVEAVVANDLVGAVTRADSDNLRVIKLLALTNYQCYL